MEGWRGCSMGQTLAAPAWKAKCSSPEPAAKWVAHTCDSSAPMERWEAGTGEPLEAHWLASLEWIVVNIRFCTKEYGSWEHLLSSEVVLWPYMHHGMHTHTHSHEEKKEWYKVKVSIQFPSLKYTHVYLHNDSQPFNERHSTPGICGREEEAVWLSGNRIPLFVLFL